jgi:hypothetical protein
MNRQTNQTIEYFYNRRLNEFCKLTIVNGQYIAWGKPATLKDLAKLGWRRTSQLRYESANTQ